MTENCLLSNGASVLLPVTPRRTTGESGLSAYRRYGFQCSGGASLCEIMMHWHISTDHQVEAASDVVAKDTLQAARGSACEKPFAKN